MKTIKIKFKIIKARFWIFLLKFLRFLGEKGRKVNVRNAVLIGVLALMVVGGGTTYASQKKTFYKGVKRVDVSTMRASVLFSDETEKEPQEIQAKIRRKESTQYSPSCESKGKFTYTGPDRKGLLYGTCIACETQKFLESGRTCK